MLLLCGAAYGQGRSDPTCAAAATVALPADAGSGGLSGYCDSQSLYYGYKGAPDYVKARQCAYREWEAGGYDPLNGPGILMMIYANGLGVTRNLEVAQRFACRVSGAAEAEIDGRLAHLEKLRTSGGKIDICDDITSGIMGGYCAEVQARLQRRDGEARFTRLTARWPAAHRTAFGDLRLVFGEYSELHAQQEQDLSGTARGMFVVQEREKLEDEFAEAVAIFEAGKLPRFTEAEFADADARLNAAYRRALTQKPEFQTTIRPEGIRATERVWVRYRDEWVRFGALHYPRVSADSWKVWLTRERVKLLDAVSP
jgi:hypothetical protein